MNWKCVFISCTIYLLSFAAPSSAQTSSKLDSLFASLRKADHPDTNTVKTLFTITWEFLKTRTEHDSAAKYADSAMALSTRLNYEDGIAVVHYYKGVIDRFQGNYARALDHFQKNYEYALAQGHSFRVANVLYQMAVIYSLQGEYEESLTKYLSILKIYESLNDSYSQATTLNSMGIIYKNMNKFDEAIGSYRKALELFEELDADIDKADCLSNLGAAYAAMGKYETSLEYFHQALAIDEKLKNDWGIAYQLKNIGNSLVELKKYEQALVYNLRALEISERLGKRREIAMALNSVAMNYLELGRRDDAILAVRRSLSIALEIGARTEIRDAHNLLSLLYAQKGDYQKAYEHHKLYSSNKDSLLNEENLRQINELQARYESEKKENEIAALNHERELQRAQLIQERNLRGALVAGAAFLLALIVFLVIYNRQKMRSREEIARKNEEINRQKLLELEKNQKLYALDAMISGQEVERKRIARDLHDGLGVLLATVQNHFNSIQAEIEKFEKLDVYAKANELLDEACSEVRKIAHNMMPGALLKLGLAPAVKDLCDNLTRTSNLRVEFHAFGMDERLGEATEITVYRLVQESLNNVVKHAQATEALVQLSRNNDQLSITVEDNGVGFDVAEARRKGGMGLKNLESRVKYLNGFLHIQSEKNQGTVIDIDVPVGQSIIQQS